MALVPCPECQTEVSTEALACPRCAFPYPGRKSLNLDRSLSRLHTCPDCGNPVSKQAHVCPHCGVALIGEQNGNPLNHGEQGEGQVEETWLCPHCGTPYTRKVRRSGGMGLEESAEIRGGGAGQDVASPPSRKVESAKNVECESLVVITEPSTNPLAKRRPALWQDNARPKEIESAAPKYPRNKKKSIFFALVLIILVVAAGGFGALWQLQGTNPFEILATWR
jgi:RNA polymerase subunit RPABC4/transcription elongation factor Spt4